MYSNRVSLKSCQTHNLKVHRSNTVGVDFKSYKYGLKTVKHVPMWMIFRNKERFLIFRLQASVVAGNVVQLLVKTLLKLVDVWVDQVKSSSKFDPVWIPTEGFCAIYSS